MNRADFFNSLADTWDAKCQKDRDRIKEILDLLPIRAGDTVLDVGTGTGVLIPFLLDRIGDRGAITAIDMAENMIRIAEGKFHCENVFFMARDVFTADLPPFAFNVVICYSVFPHFDNKRNAVNQLVRYLRVGGTLAICHSQGRDAINNIHKTASPIVADDNLPPALVVADYLIAAGCEISTQIDTERLFIVAGRKMESMNHMGEMSSSTGKTEAADTRQRETRTIEQ